MTENTTVNKCTNGVPNEKVGLYSLDDAIGLTKYGKYHFFIVIVCGLSIMGAVMENATVGYFLPYSKCDLNFTLQEQGVLLSSSFAGFVISSHFWGFMADTWGRKKVIRIALLGGVISSFLSAFSLNVNMLIALRFICGAFYSGVQATGFTYVSEFHTRADAPRASSFAAMFMPGCFLYLPLVGITLIPMNWSFYIWSLKFTPWRLFIIGGSFLNVANYIAFSFLPESPKFLLMMSDKKQTIQVLQKVFSNNTGESPELYPVQDIIQERIGKSLNDVKGFGNIAKFVWAQTKPIFLQPHLENTLKVSYIIFVIFAIGHGSFMWFTDFVVQMQEKLGQGFTLCEVVGHEREFTTVCADNQNIFVFEISIVIGFVFMLLSGMISFYLDQIGPRVITSVWFTISALACFSIVYLRDFYLIVLALVLFTSCSLCAAVIGAMSVNLFPTTIRGMAMSFIYMFGRIGSAFGSNIVAMLVENHCNLIYYIFVPFIITCAIVFLTIKQKPSKLSVNPT